jgi:hypothetical protein
MYTEFFIAVGAFLFWRTESYLVIKNVIATNFNNFKDVKSLVSTSNNKKKKYTILWISLKLIFQAIYISFIQYMNTSVRHIDNKKSELTYVINGRIYKMIITHKRGPSPILQISNNFENDVTNQILPYMGPQYDWHGNTFTPEFFGYSSLTFEFGDGTEYTYQTNDLLLTQLKN